MDNETLAVTQEIMTRVDALAAKLGVVGPQMLDWVVQKAIITAWMGVIGIVLCWISVFSLYLTGLLCKDREIKEGFWITAGVFSFIFIIVTVFTLIWAVPTLMVPEAKGISELMRMLGHLR